MNTGAWTHDNKFIYSTVSSPIKYIILDPFAINNSTVFSMQQETSSILDTTYLSKLVFYPFLPNTSSVNFIAGFLNGFTILQSGLPNLIYETNITRQNFPMANGEKVIQFVADN